MSIAIVLGQALSPLERNCVVQINVKANNIRQYGVCMYGVGLVEYIATCTV